MEDPDQAILLTRLLIDATPRDHEDRVEYLDYLENQLADRYADSGAIVDLEDAISIAREAIHATKKEHQLDRVARLNTLGNRLYERFLVREEMGYLDEAIQVAQEAVNATTQEHQDFVVHLDNLGVRLNARYSKAGNIADLEEAIRIARAVIDAAPEDDQYREEYLDCLGDRLHSRYLKMAALDDLDEAIQIVSKLLDYISKDHPNRAEWLNDLSNRFEDRYRKMGVITDLENSIVLAQQAVDAVPKDHPNRAAYLNNLGGRLRERYLTTGNMIELEEAIRITRIAVDLTPDNDEDQAVYLSNLGIQLGDRYMKTRIMADAKEGVEVARKAVGRIPEEHPGRGNCLDCLGNRLFGRYLGMGAVVDLEEAVSVARDAVNVTPEGHPDRASYLNNLGIGLAERSSRSGAITDLNEAIQVIEEAYNSTAEGNPGRIPILENLGVRLHDRYLRTGSTAALNDAIRFAQIVLVATPNGHPDQARRLNHVAIGLGSRYDERKETVDLDDTIRLIQAAVAITPEENAEWGWWLQNLGNRLNDRYVTTGAIVDLEEATRVTREAVNVTPDDHMGRAAMLNNLGNRLYDRYLKLEERTDFEEALSYHQLALRSKTAFTIHRVSAARAILRKCAVNSDWQQAYEASRIAIHLFPKLSPRSLLNSDKQHVLSQVSGFASDAAAVAIHASQGPLDALHFLEEGRGALATSLEELRIDTMELREKYPELAKNFENLRNELDVPAIRIGSSSTNIYAATQDQSKRRSDADKELDNLVEEIRQKPGFQSFLRAPSEREIRAAASRGPIVVINVSEYGCDAILVEQHSVRSLELPNLHENEVKTKAKEGNLSDPRILQWLWDVVMNPILDALGFTHPPADENWPHVWWIPTGPLSRFPLHAAGYHDKGSSAAVLDRVMSSYSSSIKAIIHNVRRPVSPLAYAQALLVAMEDTPGSNVLHFANKEVEMLHEQCKSMKLEPIQPGRRKDDIILHLPRSKIFHFAGHAYANNFDPSQSQLLLDDWKTDPLLVATLLDMNIRESSPFLAYLSACGTGQVRENRFLDESIHLISAFQLVGFRHVIGTLWEVNDELCVDMAKMTYEGMKNGGITDDSVCRGLHNATRTLRDRWVNTTTGVRWKGGSSETAATSLSANTRGASNVIGGHDRSDKFPRDINPLEEEKASLDWVPYVHFGV